MEDEEKQTIKDMYKDLIEIAEVNHPNYYMMPKTFYDNICKELEKFQLYFRRNKQSIASWRARAEKAEAELKSIKMEKVSSNPNALEDENDN